jgi:hypothetical protein
MPNHILIIAAAAIAALVITHLVTTAAIATLNIRMSIVVMTAHPVIAASRLLLLPPLPQHLHLAIAVHHLVMAAGHPRLLAVRPPTLLHNQK